MSNQYFLSNILYIHYCYYNLHSLCRYHYFHKKGSYYKERNLLNKTCYYNSFYYFHNCHY